MAFTFPVLQDKREGDVNVSLRDGMPIYQATWHYRLIAASPAMTRKEVLQFPGVPVVGDTVDDDAFGVCESVRADRSAENPIIWDITAIFTTLVMTVDVGGTQGNPSSDPTTWTPRRKTIFYQKDHWFYKDTLNKLYLNSAGQWLTGIPARKRTLVAWRFVQFEPATVTDEQIADRNEKTNASTFKGKAARTLLCCVEDSEIGNYYGRWLRLTQYLLKYDPLTWDTERYDVGTVYKSGSDWLPWLDKAGNVVEGGLDGSGGKVAIGTDPAKLTFRDYATDSFSFLRI